jgi:hypothetical protein
MAISDGMRTHTEGNIPKYRMPDLLSLEEMQLYFLGTYGLRINIEPASEEELERANGVGVLPAPSVVSDRDREHATLREQLGLTELEAKLDLLLEGRVKELDSRTMTREQFEEKYGKQPEIETPEEKQERLGTSEEDVEFPDEAKGSPDDTSGDVEGPLPTFEASDENQKQAPSPVVNQEEDRDDLELPEKDDNSPTDELNRLLSQRDKNE